uniref:Uncharacterized protein n=1 Tax=Brassica oleracea var. oleracea TaxID=109376 RepID=A0A0D3D573_BRAOL
MNLRKFPRNISSEYTEGLLPRNIPRDSFLGIFRGTHSSEFSEGSVPRKFPMKILRNISSELPRIGPSEISLGIFRGAFRRTGGPLLGNSFPRNSVGNF